MFEYFKIGQNLIIKTKISNSGLYYYKYIVETCMINYSTILDVIYICVIISKLDTRIKKGFMNEYYNNI